MNCTESIVIKMLPDSSETTEGTQLYYYDATIVTMQTTTGAQFIDIEPKRTNVGYKIKIERWKMAASSYIHKSLHGYTVRAHTAQNKTTTQSPIIYLSDVV